MIRFIWQNWWRNKERFILLLVGALIVSAGLSFLVGLSQTNKGTIVDALEKRWSASYDIVVRPPDSRVVTEEKDLFEPDYLSGLSGGITLDQYHQIQDISNVDIAAPIAMIGYMSYDVALDNIHTVEQEPGIYKMERSTFTDTGPRELENTGSTYFPGGDWEPSGDIGSEYGIALFNGNLTAGTQQLVAAIDPKEESRLIGLDDAVLDQGNSRFFQESDKVEGTDNGLKIPVLMNKEQFVDQTYTYTISRLDLPFDNPDEVLEEIKEEGGRDYLDTVASMEDTKETYTFTSEETHKRFIEGVTGINPETGEDADETGDISDFAWMVQKPSALDLEPITSPYPERWPFSYDITVHHVDEPIFPTIDNDTFRKVNIFGSESDDWPRINPNWIGFYDSGQLNISQDPLTELPMETYRPASAELVLDDEKEPVNPPVNIKPSEDGFGLLTKPPTMLTTLDAASEILGDKPISSIRIKVDGVTSLTEASQQKLEDVADQIENETGLITDITLGSSPQPALTHVPKRGDVDELGWIQQPWVKVGSSFSIFKESKIGFSGVVGSVILVAIIYVFASMLVSLLARRKEFAVLLAVGWRPRQLSKMIFLEAILLGAFVAIVAWTILGWVLAVQGVDTTIWRLVLSGLLGFVIYGLGAVIPAILASRIAPYEAIQSGEVTKTSKRLLRSRGVFSMAFNHLAGKWRRSVLSIFAIAVPTSLLTLFLFVTFRLKGEMYTTWLGQYVALEVGTAHYVAMAIALVIAILTTAEIMWQNIAERQPEMALLKAIGWRNHSVRKLVLFEGALSGLLAGIIGLMLAFGIIWGMYHDIPTEHIGFLLATGVIPIITGIIGASLPAERAVRILPSQGVRGEYTNLKKTERRFRWGLRIASGILVAGFLAMIITMVPQVNNDGSGETEPAVSEPTEPTTGKGGSQIDGSDETKDNDFEESMTFKNKVTLGSEMRRGSYSITAEEIVETPKEADLDKPTNGMKYVSIKVSAENVPNFSDQMDDVTFRTALFKVLLNGKLEQQASDAVFTKTYDEFKNQTLHAGEKVEAVLTFEIPKNNESLKMVWRHPESQDKFLFDIDLDETE